MLFCPASQPKMFLNAPVFQPDAILFDLEDAVAYAEKDYNLQYAYNHKI